MASTSSNPLASLDTAEVLTLDTFISRQRALESAAAELMPFSIKHCSYLQGPVKQTLFACKDCGGKGVCYACSVSCHGSHQLVELFPRRNFVCECPTSACPYPSAYPPSLEPSSSTSHLPPSHTKCTLYTPSPASNYAPQPIPAPKTNAHTKNFKGEFCRCERGNTYDPMEEKESMVCCLGCEEWYHESCLNLQDPKKYTSPPVLPTTPAPPLTPSSPVSASPSAAPGDTSIASVLTTGADAEYDADEDEDESPLLNSQAYEHLICASCVLKHPLLRRMAGTEGWMMVVPHGEDGRGAVHGDSKVPEWKDGWKVIARPQGGKGLDEVVKAESNGVEEDAPVTGQKRKAEEDGAETDGTKKARLSPSATASTSTLCTLPSPNPIAQATLDTLPSSADEINALPGSKGDVFLVDGFREKICRCEKCADKVKNLPFPLEEEAIWEPPREEEPEESIDDLTSKALDNMPRSQAIEGMLKLNAIKDQFVTFLQPFKESGKVVTKEDVNEFLGKMREAGA